MGRPRNCTRCGEATYECMGSVKAGDILEVEAGIREWSAVREICGRCAMQGLIYEDDPEGFERYVNDAFNERGEPPAQAPLTAAKMGTRGSEIDRR